MAQVEELTLENLYPRSIHHELIPLIKLFCASHHLKAMWVFRLPIDSSEPIKTIRIFGYTEPHYSLKRLAKILVRKFETIDEAVQKARSTNIQKLRKIRERPELHKRKRKFTTTNMMRQARRRVVKRIIKNYQGGDLREAIECIPHIQDYIQEMYPNKPFII